ncbi:FimV-like protein [Paraburkholderia sp. RAU2J]|uniref:FimV/HubP family polar landmark protein n=1 Tax=Paraburkholderia sp. RAU2J TaxID=1938810 RepID=UPI000EB100D2|nr:FimV/HubP family polar landmark protein [Paraburkholderia sp. RAU2J]RKT20621.1 FimV-like protein [Paraburkholderia sp. RAU2J]
MNLRFSSIRAMFSHQDKGRLTSRPAAAAALAFVLTGVGAGSAVAAPGDGASAPDAASVSYVAGSQYTVRPGQSLNDVAIAVTQSHDRATLVRASRALFDANPSAFMAHDPSRMRVGAVLTVPALDASGALAASSAAAQGAAGGSAPNAAVGASGAAQVDATAASAASASAAAHASASAAPAVAGTASAVAQANSPASSSAAVSGAITSAPAVAGSQVAAAPASDAHEWSGTIQPPASAPTESAPTLATGIARAPGAAQSASQPRAQVSSLQQLLALKNRVLMELQKHGIGGAPVATSGTAAAGAAKPVAGASPAASAASDHGAAAVGPASNGGGMSQKELSIAAAVGAALVVLLAALRMRRRKREGVASADGEVAASARASDPQDGDAVRGQTPKGEVSGADDGDAARQAAALAVAERAAAERAAAEQAAAEQAAVDKAAAEHTTTERAVAERAESERAAAEQAAAEHQAAEQAAAAEQQAAADRAAAEHEPLIQESHTEPPVQDSPPSEPVGQEQTASPTSFDLSRPATDAPARAETGVIAEPLPPAAAQESSASATTAASLAAAADLGAEALPLTSLEPIDDEALPAGEPAHGLQPNDEPASDTPATPQEPVTEPQNHLNVPSPVIDFTQQHIEPRATSPFGQPYPDVSADAFPETTARAPQPAPGAPTEFPREAVDAFSGLDMPLPPRIETPADSVPSPASLSTQPVASPETTAQQALASDDLDDAPHIADEIAAGTAGHAAVAGLGAAGFGALKLDFDLELPPSPAQPLPAFTQADLVRIARNKLDLASEYIELGDLSGARSLINEVIEANDPATRTEARALLSTLAPLS